MAGALHPDGDIISGDRFRSIGEAAAETGVKPHVLRYWEECFSQLRPMKRAGGRRYYRRADLDLIRHIDDLVNKQGYTFAGARAMLAGGPPPPSAAPSAALSSAAAAPSFAAPSQAAPQAAPAALTAHQRQALLDLRGELSAMLATVRHR